MPNLKLLYVRARTREIFIEGDATTVRTLLACGSFGWTVGMWWPLHTFARPSYSWMAAVASERTWGAVMLVHFLGVIWRLYDPVPRPVVGFWVHAYGVALWTFMVGCITFAVGEYSPGLAIEICLIVAAWVALVRTGSNEGKGTP